MPTDPIPDSYAAWKHCITVECRIPLTRAFVEQRLAVWENPNLEETNDSGVATETRIGGESWAGFSNRWRN